ncbi:hypothetical protein FACS1894200_14580 [Spirochaetia bacterium]|nr:hypothetical protein FACS1894200_14580 [Spirochaetia bacterium]
MLHAEEDKKEREKAEVRNEADSLIYGTEKNIKDLGEKVSGEDKAKCDEAIADLRKALEGGDIQAIKDKTEALKQASYKIAEELYKSQAAQQEAPGQSGPGNAGSPSSGTVDDVDYEVVHDDKDDK